MFKRLQRKICIIAERGASGALNIVTSPQYHCGQTNHKASDCKFKEATCHDCGKKVLIRVVYRTDYFRVVCLHVYSIVFILVSILFLFALSVIYQCHLTWFVYSTLNGPSIEDGRCRSSRVRAKFVATPLTP